MEFDKTICKYSPPIKKNLIFHSNIYLLWRMFYSIHSSKLENLLRLSSGGGYEKM